MSVRIRRQAQAGDVVELKSGGGPRMTYAYTTGNGKAVCRYFSAAGNLYNHELEPCTLKVIEEDE